MFCNKCGKEIDSNAKFCKYCGTTTNNIQQTQAQFQNLNYSTNVKTKKKIYQQWWFWLIIIIFAIAIIGSAMNLTNTTNQVSSNVVNNQTNNSNEKNEIKNENKDKEGETKLSKKEYKKQCKNYKYEQIARNPSKYKGKLVTFSGEVIQVQEGWFDTVTLRINVTKSEYGFYKDTIYCTYTYSKDEDKILEDDIITLYGECKGSTSYTSILGEKITLPEVEIKYLEIKK